MNEAEDPEPMDEEIGGSDAGGTGLPWHLPTGEEGTKDEGLGSEGKTVAEEDVESESSEDLDAKPTTETATSAGILRVWCPACEHEVNISREHLGMQGKCPSCDLPIVASMRPDDSGAMRVVATEVLVQEEASVVDDVETIDEERDRLAAAADILVPAWMKSSLDSEPEVDEVADEDDIQSEEDENAEEELNEFNWPDSDDTESEDEGTAPSWVEGGNPWNALGLDEKQPDETSDEAKDESTVDSDSMEGPVDLDSPDAEESGNDDEEDENEGLLQEEEESRLGLIVAVVIIIVVGGCGLTAYLMRDSKTPQDKMAVEQVAQTSKVSKNEKPTENKKKASEKAEKKEPKSSSSDTVMTAGAGSEKSTKGGKDEMKVASKEPGAIRRPDGKDKPAADKKPSPISVGPKPKMATARVDVSDEVAVRMHQEGERAIRRFYRARSIEERSVFVANPGRALKSMRKFYGERGNLPTIRYLEFKGKLQDPTSGLRFGVFDVHEKENEESHRWCVVEIEPSQYALDWGFYEQLEGSTLIDYLSKEQSSSKKFRFLMKLGDLVSAVDSPWDEAAIQIHLQLPLAGGGGGETILLKKTDAEGFGILKELANGQMKIGRVRLDWVGSDKDPGSKVPTITELEGWGAWSKPKLRGLN